MKNLSLFVVVLSIELLTMCSNSLANQSSFVKSVDGIEFLHPTAIADQLKQFVFPCGQIVYCSLQNEQWRLLSTSMNLPMQKGDITFTLKGTVPNLFVQGANNEEYVIHYAMQNGILNYFIFTDSEMLVLPLNGGSIVSLEQLNVWAHPEKSASQLELVKRVVSSDNQITYYGLFNGQYLSLSEGIIINEPTSGNVSVHLSGIPPNVVLEGSNGLVYQLLYTDENGALDFFIIINFQMIQIDLEGGLPMFITDSSVIGKYLREYVFPCGQIIYFSLQHGQWRLLPMSFDFTINGGNQKFMLKGTVPNLMAIGSNNQVYDIKYLIENGNFNLYMMIDGGLANIPVEGSVIYPRELPSMVFPPLSSRMPIEKRIITPDGLMLYYGLISGKYLSLPGFELLSSNNNAPIALTVTGNPPNLFEKDQSGTCYQILYSVVNGAADFFIIVNARKMSLRGNSNILSMEMKSLPPPSKSNAPLEQNTATTPPPAPIPAIIPTTPPPLSSPPIKPITPPPPPPPIKSQHSPSISSLISQTLISN